MFLTPPTVEDLVQSELSDLVDMLAKQSAEYARLCKIEGKSPKTEATKELILRLHEAIELKKSAQLRSRGSNRI